MSALGRLRRIRLVVHRWIGIGLCLAFIPLGLSGSYLVWRGEIERAVHPARYPANAAPAALPASAYLAAAQAAFGERASPSVLRLPERQGDPVVVTGQGRRDARGPGASSGRGRLQRPPGLTAWLDPASGRPLDVGDPRSGLSGWMHDLHGQLFMFGGGRRLVGWIGWAMLASSLTGLWLWWPRTGSVVAGLGWRRMGVLQNLHYLIGAWMVAPLAVLALTGALIAFPGFTRATVALVAPVGPPRAGGPGRNGQPLARTRLSADEAVAAARAAVPDGRLLMLSVPTRGASAPAWKVQLARASAPPATVVVADEPGAGAALQPAPAQRAGDSLIRLNRTVHDGNGMALVWKLIISLAGAAPTLLALTGVSIWASRRLRRPRAEAQRAD